VAEELTAQQQRDATLDVGPISWWSWRPGIKPRNALLIGGLISCMALVLASIGLIALVLSMLDSLSPPLQIPGIVTKHIANSLDGQPRLIFRLHTMGLPAEASAAVSDLDFRTIHDGDHILLDYTPHLHLLYALEHAGQHSMLPGSSTGGVFLGSIALLSSGLLFLAYPVVLANWGWLDLYGHDKEHRRCEMTAKVVGLRAAVQTRASRPGLTPRTSSTWYGVALYPVSVSSPPSELGAMNWAPTQQVMTFAISEHLYRSLHEGDVVRIIYSHHLHYAYSLEALP